MTTTKVPVELSSTPGIVDNSNATAITIDSDENVTIGSVGTGTASATPVELNLGSTFANSAGSLSKAKFKLFEDSSANVYGLSVSSGFMEFGVPSSAGYAFFVNESEKMRINSGGYVNPKSNVALTNAPDTQGLHFGWNYSNGAGESLIVFNKGAGTTGGLTFVDNSSSGTHDEAMRIESGNLLVGRTQVGSTGAGHSIRGADSAIFSRDNGEAIITNRGSSNGKLIELRKDGTEFANIQVLNNNNLAIMGSVADHGGIQFGTHNMVPMEAGVDADGTIALGSSNNRWKELYLSGGVYLGGTGSANELSDYEEGTFTPAVVTSGYTISSASGKYTKVGRLVTLHFIVRFSAVPTANSSCSFSGQPFESTTNSIHQPGMARETDNTGAIYVLQANHTSDRIAMNSMDGVSDGTQRTIRTNENYNCFLCYTTSS